MGIEQPCIDALDDAWDCEVGGTRFESWKNGWLTGFQGKSAELYPRVNLSWKMGRKERE